MTGRIFLMPGAPIFAALAFAILPSAVVAAPQALGLVATAEPTPLQCEDGVCQGFFTAFCLSSHPSLRGDIDLLERLLDLSPGRKGLDAGCGAGARDVLSSVGLGFDVQGIDVVSENIEEARSEHPEMLTE